MYYDDLHYINFSNSNSRDTYFTIHNVKEAHKYGKGKGIKVGIIDWCFGFNEHHDLYTDGIDISGNPIFLYDKSEHGYWMAQALKEIAPECQIYAINYLNGDNFNERAKYIVKSIEWAIHNKIDILTYSGSMFNTYEREIIDKAVETAITAGIITTFIHYDYKNNFYPGALMKFHEGNREPDIRILHYDYNTLFIDKYIKYISTNITELKSGENIPYLSISSTSPVLAGFIAILKCIDNTLTLNKCKEILKKTSYATHFKGYATWDDVDIDNVADIGASAKYVHQMVKH
jgi:hypothetical protein